MPSVTAQPIDKEIIKKELIDSAEEVIIGSEQGTTFPTKVGPTLCNALIDTGATKSCMSESYYKTLHWIVFVQWLIHMLNQLQVVICHL